jgi:hypothetical protein
MAPIKQLFFIVLAELARHNLILYIKRTPISYPAL